MEQGLNVFENVPLAVAPGQIDAVFLTHAHIDHSGMLPKLYKDGFRGKVYATQATENLSRIMLMDSAHIQQSDAEWMSRKAVRAGRAAVEPVYTTEDAAGVLRLMRPCSYAERIKVAEGVELRFTDVGHLLGSACVELWLTENGETRKIVFSGDVGNTDQPILSDPLTVDEADYLVIESTYGNRLHEKAGDTVAELAAVLQRAFDRGGSVIVPAFAVGRTQELLYAIREIKQKRLVQGHDGWPVYLDSPLAEAATAVFMQCDPEYLDGETRELLRQGINPLWSANLYLTESVEESKKINDDPRPKVILSASGMCDAGRIRHHLKHNLWRWENIILFAGYQAEGTLGRSLLSGAKPSACSGRKSRSTRRSAPCTAQAVTRTETAFSTGSTHSRASRALCLSTTAMKKTARHSATALSLRATARSHRSAGRNLTCCKASSSWSQRGSALRKRAAQERTKPLRSSWRRRSGSLRSQWPARSSRTSACAALPRRSKC